MKRFLSLLCCMLLLRSFTFAALAADASNYTDASSKAEFAVPSGWEKKPLSKERNTLDVQFVNTKDALAVIMYGCNDVWTLLGEAERRGLSREDIDNSVFNPKDISDIYNIPRSQIKRVNLGESEFFIATVNPSANVYGLNLSVEMTQAVFIYNGYMHLFQFSGGPDHPLYGDFEKTLSSLNVPQVAKSSSGAGSIVADILLSIIITVVIYSLPIIIYRYGVLKHPVEPKKAKKISIIYGICAFIVMSLILISTGSGTAAGGAIVIWSLINNKILVSPSKHDIAGAASEADTIDVPDEFVSLSDKIKAAEQAQSASDTSVLTAAKVEAMPENVSTGKAAIRFCRKCGFELIGGSGFCSRCGNRIEKLWEIEAADY